MKRKVIQLAGKTSVISLPNQWVKNYGVNKGDELDIEEIADTLVVKIVKHGTELKKISLKIDGFNERTLRYAISALHKLGYDEITLNYDSHKLGDAIQNLLQNLLLGFVVIEQTSKKLVLKNVSNEIDTEFNPTLRRAFLVTISLADSSLDMISNKQFSSLNSLIALENSNNQLTSFCLRLINKGFYKELDKKSFIITIIWNLEKIADEYKAICLGLSKNNKEINSQILKLYKEVNEFFKSYYELFYGFSPEKLNKLVDKKENIINGINKVNINNEYELKLVNLLFSITSKTSDLSSSIFAFNSEELLN